MCRIGRHVMWLDLSLKTAWIQRKPWTSLRMLLGFYVKKIDTWYSNRQLKDLKEFYWWRGGGGCGGRGTGGEKEGVKWESRPLLGLKGLFTFGIVDRT